MKFIREYFRCLLDRQIMSMAIKVALVVGSVLAIVNHGSAILAGTMNRDRWISVGLTYLVPYGVNIHGQYISRKKRY